TWFPAEDGLNLAVFLGRQIVLLDEFGRDGRFSHGINETNREQRMRPPRSGDKRNGGPGFGFRVSGSGFRISRLSLRLALRLPRGAQGLGRKLNAGTRNPELGTRNSEPETLLRRPAAL